MSEKILWIDDEIDLLKPHIIILEKKGYQVNPVNNVNEALELMDSEKFALTLIDENMPGISGLEAIPMIKEKDNALKIVEFLQKCLCFGKGPPNFLRSGFK